MQRLMSYSLGKVAITRAFRGIIKRERQPYNMQRLMSHFKGKKMQRKINEQEIKEFEIELKEIDKRLDELRPIRDELNRMHEAEDLYSELNMEAADIESLIHRLKAAQQEGTVVEDGRRIEPDHPFTQHYANVRSTIEDTEITSSFIPPTEIYCSEVQAALNKQQKKLSTIAGLIDQMPLEDRDKAALIQFLYPQNKR